MSDFCFVIACHDKIEELLCHLEILTFCPEPHDVIVVHSGPIPLPSVDILRGVTVVRSESVTHAPLGAALALWKGIFTVRRPPFPYIQHTFRHMCYRNCDDWLFNPKHTGETLEIMRTQGKKLAGYNWFDRDVYTNLTLNELFADMSIFEGQKLEDWVPYFKEKIKGKCEFAVADKLFPLLKKGEFLRFIEREQETGIGIYAKWQHNSRFWNAKWLLLGHHNQEEKRQAYNNVRHMIPYAKELETKEYFGNWLKGKVFNLPHVVSAPPPEPSPN